MPEMTLEIHADRATGRCLVWWSVPAFGTSPEPPHGARWRGVLNNGTVRVRVGVYGDALTLAEVQMIAKIAVSDDCPIDHV